MGYENFKNAAQFPSMQPKNTSLFPNATPFIDFGLNLLATGCVELTIRISVVMRPLNFSWVKPRILKQPLFIITLVLLLIEVGYQYPAINGNMLSMLICERFVDTPQSNNLLLNA